MNKNMTLRLLAVMLCLVTCLMVASCDLVDQYLGKDSEETTAEQTTDTADTAESQTTEITETTEAAKDETTEPAVADTIGHGDAMGDDDFMTVVWGNTQE